MIFLSCQPLLSSGSLFLGGSLFGYGSLFLGGNFFLCGSLFGYGSFFLSLSGSLLARLAGAGASLSSFLFLSLGSFLVGLLSLALLQTFGDGSAASVQNHLDRVLGIVVGGDDKVDVVGVAVGVNNTEHGNAQTVGLFHSDVLFHHIHHEYGARQTGKVGN